jgi:hypothetical protein
VDREKQAIFSMGKEDTMGEVGLDETELCASQQRAICLLEECATDFDSVGEWLKQLKQQSDKLLIGKAFLPSAIERGAPHS